MVRRIFLLLLGLLCLQPSFITAQSDCGVVDQVVFPVDRASFTRAQGFAVASPRHQGRYHTGDDWHAGAGNTLGQPVRAAARGRVTYSFDQGWGRDGGVIILEHLFPDGSIYYTQYGHLSSVSYPFPARLSCVEAGEIIGAIGDVRPAPHLHFEVRVEALDTGITVGAGYERETPYSLGYRDPAKFITNQQAWLSNWHRWHLMIGSESAADERGPRAPLLALNDESLLYLDGSGMTLRRATRDGRILWRIRLDVPAVAITAWRGSSLLTLADGTMAQINVETGSLAESWRVDAMFSGAPLLLGDDLAFPDGDSLIVVGADRRSVVARIPDVPPYQGAFILPDGRIAFETDDQRLIVIDADGQRITEAVLRDSVNFGTTPAGDLLAYTQGGLWRIDENGVWSLYIVDAPRPAGASALLTTPERLYLYDGTRLHAYNRDLQMVWQAGLPPLTGRVQIYAYDASLLLTSSDGQLVWVNPAGGFCNQAQIAGSAGAQQWQRLGSDDVLRLALADQIIGIDWNIATRPCTG